MDVIHGTGNFLNAYKRQVISVNWDFKYVGGRCYTSIFIPDSATHNKPEKFLHIVGGGDKLGNLNTLDPYQGREGPQAPHDRLSLFHYFRDLTSICGRSHT